MHSNASRLKTRWRELKEFGGGQFGVFFTTCATQRVHGYAFSLWAGLPGFQAEQTLVFCDSGSWHKLSGLGIDGALGEAGDAGQNLVRAFGPGKGFGMGIVGLEKLADGALHPHYPPTAKPPWPYGCLSLEPSSWLFSCGLTVERTTINLFSRSNQKGAPRETAMAVISQPSR